MSDAGEFTIENEVGSQVKVESKSSHPKLLFGPSEPIILNQPIKLKSQYCTETTFKDSSSRSQFQLHHEQSPEVILSTKHME